MSEKKALTGREKFLLFLMAAVALLYATVQFGITPAREALTQKRASYQEVSDQKITMETTILTEASVRQRNEEAKVNSEQVSALYPARMTTEELIQDINDLCARVGLYPVSLDANPDGWGGLGFSEGELEATEEGLDTAPLIMAEVELVVTGDLNTVATLVDEVNKTNYIRVTGITLPLQNNYIPIILEVVMRNVEETVE